jgi:hypothetical protein
VQSSWIKLGPLGTPCFWVGGGTHCPRNGDKARFREWQVWVGSGEILPLHQDEIKPFFFLLGLFYWRKSQNNNNFCLGQWFPTWDVVFLIICKFSFVSETILFQLWCNLHSWELFITSILTGITPNVSVHSKTFAFAVQVSRKRFLAKYAILN